MENKQYDVIVIGGGASGMMAAGTAARNGNNVLILEKNKRVGEKLAITGGGRCNITNATFDDSELLPVFGDAEKFLYSPFSQFGVEDTFAFFERWGLTLVTQARRRVFPRTEKATDVVRVMQEYINLDNVKVYTDCPVTGITKDRYSATVTSVTTNKGEYTADNYIIATGGSSHPETGATGDGFQWLKDLGHTVKDPTPTIVPLRIKEDWVKELAGKSLSFMKITFYVEGKRKFKRTGKVLFTHFGISGPLILNAAHKVADLLYEGVVTAAIDCYPDTDSGALDRQVLRVFNENKNKSFKNITKELAPTGCSSIFSMFEGMPDPDEKVHSIAKEKRKKMVNLLKSLPLTIQGLMGMDRAVIADGGIRLSEIYTKTMQSKKFSNLYVTGDVLHINRPSGGYSLQLCWTTGYVAGLLNNK